LPIFIWLLAYLLQAYKGSFLSGKLILFLLNFFSYFYMTFVVLSQKFLTQVKFVKIYFYVFWVLWLVWANLEIHSSILCNCIINFLILQDCIIYLFIYFGVWTQGFTLAKQALYLLSHNSSPFCLVILEIGSLKLLGFNCSPPNLSLPSG
jgi:hypothetical protein